MARILLAAWLPLFLATAALAAPPPDYSDHADLSTYRDDAGQPHAINTANDWAIRRRHILLGMQQAMGDLPDRTKLPPLDVQVTHDEKQPGVRRLTLSFVAEEADRVTAYLYLPVGLKPGERRAAMLALHPTGALGKAIVAGDGPRANRAYGVELAQRGYVVIAPDYPSFGDLADYNFESDRYVSGTMKGIFNHMRAVDLLQAREEVDPRRIGVIGHSLGGHNAMFVAAFDERITAIVSSCGWTPFHDYYGGKIAGWTSDRYMPLLRDRYELDPGRVPFDFYELAAALAPRAFFSSSPLHDSNFDVAGVRKAEPVARTIYELLAAGDNLTIVYPDCDHDFPPDVRRQAYEFVDRALRHMPDPQAKPLE